MKRHFAELCEDERFQDPDSLFQVNIFCRVLDTIINQLRSRFLGINEIVSNVSVLLQPTTLQNLNDTDLLEKALVFVDLYKKAYLSRLQRKFSVFDPLLDTKYKRHLL